MLATIKAWAVFSCGPDRTSRIEALPAESWCCPEESTVVEGEAPARTTATVAEGSPTTGIVSWRDKAYIELEKVVTLFSSRELPDICLKALIKAPQKPSSKWSFGNQLLMFLAGTEDARGYRQWGDVGRFVRKGSKAFYILGPVFVKKRLESSDPSEGEEVEVLVGFRVIPVFKLEDTDGAELPTYTPRNPPPLLDVAVKFGMKVNYLRLSSGDYGLVDYERQNITLATEDWTVFWHELAHAIHRSYEPKTGHGQEPEAEAVAQLVAATLARLYGKPDDSFSWTYISTQAQSSSPQQVGRLCMRVLDRAKKVLDLIYPVSDVGP
jgi:hypothetical protein